MLSFTTHRVSFSNVCQSNLNIRLRNKKGFMSPGKVKHYFKGNPEGSRFSVKDLKVWSSYPHRMYQGWPWHCVESWHNFWRRLLIWKCSICLHWSSLVYFVLQWRSNPPLANVNHITSINTLGKSMNDPSKRSKIEKNYLWLAKITEAYYMAWYQLSAVFICNCQSFLWKRHVGRIQLLWILYPVFQCYITAKLMMSK